jgi:hypothetical protein
VTRPLTETAPGIKCQMSSVVDFFDTWHMAHLSLELTDA